MDTWFLSPPLDILLPLGWSTFFSLAAGMAPEHGTPKKFPEYFWEMKLAVWGGNDGWRRFLFMAVTTQTWKYIMETVMEGDLRMNQTSHKEQQQKKSGL